MSKPAGENPLNIQNHAKRELPGLQKALPPAILAQAAAAAASGAILELQNTAPGKALPYAPKPAKGR